MTVSDTSSAVVGRYAPSPTGALHLGNLRTALASWAHARSRGGRFLLRVEDIDTPRVRPGCEQRQLDDLAKLGFDWDDQPLRQSEREADYALAFEKLLQVNRVYPCFCSRKDIQLALSAPHRSDNIIGYPGTCRHLSPDAARARIESGDQHCWRLRVDGSPTLLADEFAGNILIDLQREGGDFVVRRADGLFAYQLVCAWDDSTSGITHVLRGEDLLDSAARQAWLLSTLSMPVPVWLHLPLMNGEDGRRLSKRDGDADLSAFLSAGYDTTAIRSYLAWTLGQTQRGERITMDELAARFDLNSIPKHAVTFRESDLRFFRPSV